MKCGSLLCCCRVLPFCPVIATLRRVEHRRFHQGRRFATSCAARSGGFPGRALDDVHGLQRGAMVGSEGVVFVTEDDAHQLCFSVVVLAPQGSDSIRRAAWQRMRTLGSIGQPILVRMNRQSLSCISVTSNPCSPGELHSNNTFAQQRCCLLTCRTRQTREQ